MELQAENILAIATIIGPLLTAIATYIVAVSRVKKDRTEDKVASMGGGVMDAFEKIGSMSLEMTKEVRSQLEACNLSLEKLEIESHRKDERLARIHQLSIEAISGVTISKTIKVTKLLAVDALTKISAIAANKGE